MRHSNDGINRSYVPLLQCSIAELSNEIRKVFTMWGQNHPNDYYLCYRVYSWGVFYLQLDLYDESTEGCVTISVQLPFWQTFLFLLVQEEEKLNTCSAEIIGYCRQILQQQTLYNREREKMNSYWYGKV